MIKVVKFGGTSLANGKQMRKAWKIIKKDSDIRFVIPSAPGKRYDTDTKVTDLLYTCYGLAICEEEFEETLAEIQARYMDIIQDLNLDLDLQEEFKLIQKNFTKKIGRDYAASRGEYLNGKILSAYLEIPFLDAAEAICFTEEGEFLPEKTNQVLGEKLEKLGSAVIPGFYGASPSGKIFTFSRGGSDLTGSIVAKAVHADMYENWTDVSGFLIADPRIIQQPKGIEVITYRELRELSYMGASVLHEDAIFPVQKEGIPIHIRNMNHPETPGTLIVEDTCRKSRFVITGIAGKKDFASITIEKARMNREIGFCRKVLSVFEDNGISFEHMPSGIDTMTVFVHQELLAEKEQNVISGIYRAVQPDSLELESDLALIAVVGRGMRSTRGTSGRIFSALAHANINVKMIDQGSSERNIIIGVHNHDFELAIRSIYDVFVNTVT